MISPEDRKRLQDNQLEIERTLARNRVALETSRRESAKYRRTLATAGAEVQSALSDLRRLGYLK